MNKLVIGGKEISEKSPTFIVAEIGQNHNGDMNIARQLIDVAKEAGVDAVKFVKRDIESELTREQYNKPYDNPNSFGETYGKHREYLELSVEQHRELKEYANSKGLIYFSSACDIKSVNDMEEIGVPAYKIASRDLTNIPLIEYIAKIGKPMILSTGMATLEDIDDAVNTIRKYHNDFALLHCTSEYPTPYEHVNLRRIFTLKKRYDCIVGASDHTIGIMIPVVAVALGAKIIEKHITLHRYMKGTDHAGSLEPDGIKRVVRDIRNFEKALGSDKFELKDYLFKSRNKLARSLVSKKEIKKGEVLVEDMLTLKSPGTGLLWRERYKILGKVANRDIECDVTLKEEYFD